MAVLQRTVGISSECTRLGKQVSDRLTCTPLSGSAEVKEKPTGKFVPLWGASRSARKKVSCARPHWRKFRV